MKKMTAVSLFAGVGGFDLALERNNIKVKASVEIDKKAQAILARHFPDSKLFSDVTTVTGADLIEAGFDPSNGVLVGGFPCQDVSVAGKRKGLKNEDGSATRSGLFWEVVRLLEETQAKYFILENVPGLLSSNSGRDFGTVLGALVNRGYGVSYRILDSQYYGVAQRRRRVFIVGVFGDDGGASASLLDIVESRARYLAQSAATGKESTRPTPSSIRKSSGVTPFVKIVRSGARAEDGSLPAEVWAEREVAPTLNSMDNTGESRATVIAFHPHRSDGVRLLGETSNTLSAFMGTGGLNTPAIAIQGSMIGRSDTAGPQGKGFAEPDAPMYTIDTVSGHGVAYKEENLSAPVTPFTPTSFAQYEEGVGTLRSNGGDLGGGSEVLIEDGLTVRRLTPVECERLQGFPDNWTEGQADSHRYKQMGNALTVNVAQWIISNLVKLEQSS